MTEDSRVSTIGSSSTIAPQCQPALVGRLFFLDLAGGRVLSANPDGTGVTTLVEEGRKLPDGLAVDIAAGHLYWTNMGNPKVNDGSILRSDLDGVNMTTIVPPGGTFTPKQLQIEKSSGKLYWCDREGMRVMRSNLDGSSIETLVDTSRGDPRPGTDPTKWCVGIAVDIEKGKFYWTQKGGDNARTGLHPAREHRHAARADGGEPCDIEVLYDGPARADRSRYRPGTRMLYWTDRGDPPHGNTVNRAPLDVVGRQARRAGDRVRPPDGRHRPGARSQGRPHVRDRFRRIDLQREPRRHQPADAAVRARKP